MVELLIAMVVGLFLLAGVVQVYVSNHKATRVISGFSAQQENARVALGSITQSLRLAGHYGGIAPDEINVLGSLSITGIGSCNHSWITNTSQPIQGYEGASAIGSVTNFPSGCIDASHYVANSDILVVRYASPTTLTPISSLTGTKVYLRSALTALTGGIVGGEILLGSDASLTQVGSGSDGVGIYNYEYKTDVFYLRPCSEVNCSSCSDGVQSLVKISIDGTAFTEEIIAEGVEQFQVEYGVDTGSDYVADIYNTATSITDWRRVVSARFSLVVRNDQVDLGYADSTTYSLAGGHDYTPAAGVNSYRRKSFTKVVQLRNMSRG